jgi:2,4-dichlorophenol 6-monooxygenase
VKRIETDVLVVGLGPAGATAALALGRYGVRCIAISKYRWSANGPRAHLVNQRAMEVFRDLKAEDKILEQASRNELLAHNVFLESLTGVEYGRLYSWGNDPSRRGEYINASPTIHVDLPQDRLEPILTTEAAHAGAFIRFSTEMTDLVQSDDHVTTTVVDRLTDEKYEIRSAYVVGADGANSKVAESLGLRMIGTSNLGVVVSASFKADLARFYVNRPGLLYWFFQPGGEGWTGGSTFRFVRPWREWLLHFGFHPDHGTPDLSPEGLRPRIQSLIGDPAVDVEVGDVSTWPVNHIYAENISAGRVFCVGDAIHRHPPNNGLGSNVSVQDAYNIVWKLAYVLKGHAAPSLLTSYDPERQPIAKQTVDRAITSLGQWESLNKALRLEPGLPTPKAVANLANLRNNTADAAEQRRQLAEAIDIKRYEFQAHGVEVNQRYDSAAVVKDGTTEAPFPRDPDLYHQPSSRPGAHLPHARLLSKGKEISTLDLCGNGCFTVLTGISGAAWVEAAEKIASESPLPITVRVIGPGAHAEDIYGDWARLRETNEDGCLLVRPDQYVAFRAAKAVSNAAVVFENALSQILGRHTAPKAQPVQPLAVAAK